MGTNRDILRDQIHRLLVEHPGLPVWDTRKLHGDIFAQRLLSGKWLFKVQIQYGGFVVVEVEPNERKGDELIDALTDGAATARMLAARMPVD